MYKLYFFKIQSVNSNMLQSILNFSELLNINKLKKTKTKLRGFSPRANHTDRAAAAGRRS